MRLATCLVSVLTGFPLSRRREPPTSKDRETQDRPWVQDNLVKFCDNVRVYFPPSPPCETKIYCELFDSHKGRKLIPANERLSFRNMASCLVAHGSRLPDTPWMRLAHED
ncbi:hypothetical protein G6O67_004893 [Ophiocordyceps sinensis]|uniref:Uncharacterized protein n=1 Tax=Ophiocordyceps sinensis TaxID=72228 RepID=A0A8H4PQF5_9HYPO|nr:hypothetical protein G6O67_004893 [Ophiocordyceps sinensis]